MFGVAEDIELTGLVGRKLEQISVGVDRLEMGFDEGWALNIEGAWRLEGSAGLIAEGERDNLLDGAEQLTPLVGAVVEFAVPQPPDRIEIGLGQTRTAGIDR